MNRSLRLERPQSLTDLALTRIRDAIVEGQLRLGEQVSEAQLAQQLGVSKTPVREALVRLSRDGLVQIHPQRGTFVFRLTPEEVGQLCRYRATIEVTALREACTLNREALLRDLTARVAEMKLAEPVRDLRALADADMRFHWHFLEHCSNVYLRTGYEVIRWQLVALRTRSPIDNAVKSHQVLVTAMGRGDIERAAQLLEQHVLENESRYRAACAVA